MDQKRFIPNAEKVELLTRKLSAYDDATWAKLKSGRKKTYERAATTLLHSWEEFVKLRETWI